MTLNVTFLAHPQPRDCGDYRHRTLWPAQALGGLVPTYAVQTSHPEAFKAIMNAGVLVVGMIADSDIQALVEARKQFGRPSVYEISDDFQAFPENTSLGPSFYARPDVQAQIQHMASLCDGLQFSSPFLEEKYGHLNPCHSVFMNQAWEEPRPNALVERDRPRIGWTASGGHLNDALELARLIRDAFESHPMLREQFTLCLMTTDRIAQVFHDHGISVEHTPTGSFAAYNAFIDSLDGGIAHLQIDDFAQGRSDGKYIEYASHGVPILCHRSGTFQHTIRHLANGLHYRSPQEFCEGLSALVNDSELRAHLRKQALKDLTQTRNHEKAAHHRLSFYQRLLPTLGESHSAPPPAFEHLIHPIEDELYRLMQEHNENPGPTTMKGFFELSKRFPDSWRVWERLHDIYQRFGLTEHRDLLEQKAATTKTAALERAFANAA